MQMYEQLYEALWASGGVVVACSGGVDSAVLAAVASRALGGRMLAVTGESPSVPARDRAAAAELCRTLGIPHRVIATSEFDDPRYRANAGDRCFYCKQELFRCLERIRQELGFDWIVEGTNCSDLRGHRPGMRAKEAAPFVRAPYVELGIEKAGVRAIARHLGLDVAEKPATACLASRVPVGTTVDPADLRRIDAAETYLLGVGLTQVRVRHHGSLARIEVAPAELTRCVALHAEIVREFQQLGYRHVTLDLQGYQLGGGIHAA